MREGHWFLADAAGAPAPTSSEGFSSRVGSPHTLFTLYPILVEVNLNFLWLELTLGYTSNV